MVAINNYVDIPHNNYPCDQRLYQEEKRTDMPDWSSNVHDPAISKTVSSIKKIIQENIQYDNSHSLYFAEIKSEFDTITEVICAQK